MNSLGWKARYSSNEAVRIAIKNLIEPLSFGKKDNLKNVENTKHFEKTCHYMIIIFKTVPLKEIIWGNLLTLTEHLGNKLL